MEKGNNLENGLLLVLKTYWDLVMDYTIKSFVAAIYITPVPVFESYQTFLKHARNVTFTKHDR
jgi:hypothetical protein